MTAIDETTKAKLASYIGKSSKNAGDHDYMAGVADASGDRARARRFSSIANRRRAGISKAAKRMSEETAVNIDEVYAILSEAKKFERIEPTFGPNPNAPKPQVPKNGPVPDHMKKEPTMNGKAHPTNRIVRGDKGRYRSEPIPATPDVHSPGATAGVHHTLVINKDNSVDYHGPGGKKQQLFGAMKHKSSAHGSVLDAVKYLKHQDPNDHVHVKDASGDYRKYYNATKKSSAQHDASIIKRASVKRTPAQQRQHDHAQSAQIYPHRFTTFPDHTVSENFKENTDMVNEDKYAPKKLKDIVSKPTKKWNEYKGNTKDEQEIIQRIEDNTLKHPDRNGNGDDVFNASKLKHSEKPVEPGGDEKKYAEWNGDVKNVEEVLELIAPSMLSEATRPLTGKWGSEKITGRHLDYHWATKHVAQPGDRISTRGDDAVIHHHEPDYGHSSTTVIENGAKHITEMPKGSYDKKPEGKTHAHAGKYNVVRTTHSYGEGSGDKKVDFVASKKSKGSPGGQSHTGDESQAKEFKSYEHAQNHANLMNRYHAEFGDGGHPKHFEAYPKRDKNQIASSKKAYADAAAEHKATLAKHGHNIFAKDVQDSYHKMQAAKHPAFYGTK